MAENKNYSINLDIEYQPLDLIDIPAIIDNCTEPWFNTTLTKVNDSVVRLGIIHGDFHWHKHDEEDEFFYLVSGRLFIDLDGRTVELSPGQGFTVPRGIMHRPRAPIRTMILMVEGSGVNPLGD